MLSRPEVGVPGAFRCGLGRRLVERQLHLLGLRLELIDRVTEFALEPLDGLRAAAGLDGRVSPTDPHTAPRREVLVALRAKRRKPRLGQSGERGRSNCPVAPEAREVLGDECG